MNKARSTSPTCQTLTQSSSGNILYPGSQISISFSSGKCLWQSWPCSMPLLLLVSGSFAIDHDGMLRHALCHALWPFIMRLHDSKFEVMAMLGN